MRNVPTAVELQRWRILGVVQAAALSGVLLARILSWLL